MKKFLCVALWACLVAGINLSAAAQTMEVPNEYESIGTVTAVSTDAISIGAHRLTITPYTQFASEHEGKPAERPSAAWIGRTVAYNWEQQVNKDVVTRLLLLPVKSIPASSQSRR